MKKENPNKSGPKNIMVRNVDNSKIKAEIL